MGNVKLSKTKVLKALSFCILLLLNTTVFAHGAYHTMAEASEGSSVPTLYVSPSNIKVSKGESFRVNISLANSPPISGWQAFIHFDSSILDLKEAAAIGAVFAGTYILESLVIIYGFSWMRLESPRDLGYITVIARKDGNTSIGLNNVDTFLYDCDGFEITPVRLDGFVNVDTPHGLSVTLHVPPHLGAWEDALLYATVSNTGYNDEASVEFLLFVDGTIANYSLIPLLNHGSNFTASYKWTPESVAIHNITAFAVPVFGENFTDDNSVQVWVNMPCVINVSPSLSKAGVGFSFVVNITIDIAARLSGWQVKLCFDATVLNITKAWVPQDSVFPNNTDFVSEPVMGEGYVLMGAAVFSEDKTFIGAGTLFSIEFKVLREGSSALSFDTGCTMFLNETGNNISYFRGDGFFDSDPLGDVNRDGKVDLKDVYMLGRAYGSSLGHPRWNVACDINGDLKIDLKDYFIVCRNYGK